MGCTELDTTEATPQQQQRRGEQEEKKHTEIMTENFSRLIKTSSDGKKSACNARDQSLIPGSGRSLVEGNAILAWRIPCTKEPGKLQSMVSQKVKQD